MDKTIKAIIENKYLKKYEKLSNILKYIFIGIAQIDQNKYFLLGSFAIREHRIISDLDINLDEIEFMKLEKAVVNGLGKLEFYSGQIRWIIDLTNEYNKLTGSDEKDFSIEAFQKNPNVGFPNQDYSLQKLIKNNGLDRDMNGHYFFKLETLLAWKKSMNRPKDLPDIELILKLLQKGGKKKSRTQKKSKTQK
jgi:hypothetical protein